MAFLEFNDDLNILMSSIKIAADKLSHQLTKIKNEMKKEEAPQTQTAEHRIKKTMVRLVHGDYQNGPIGYFFLLNWAILVFSTCPWSNRCKNVKMGHT